MDWDIFESLFYGIAVHVRNARMHEHSTAADRSRNMHATCDSPLPLERFSNIDTTESLHNQEESVCVFVCVCWATSIHQSINHQTFVCLPRFRKAQLWTRWLVLVPSNAGPAMCSIFSACDPIFCCGGISLSLSLTVYIYYFPRLLHIGFPRLPSSMFVSAINHKKKRSETGLFRVDLNK